MKCAYSSLQAQLAPTGCELSLERGLGKVLQCATVSMALTRSPLNRSQNSLHPTPVTAITGSAIPTRLQGAWLWAETQWILEDLRVKLCPTDQEGMDGQETPVSEKSNGGVGEGKPEP